MNLFWARFPQCHVVPVFTGFITASKIIGRHIKRQKRGSKIVYQETESSQEEQRMYKKTEIKHCTTQVLWQLQRENEAMWMKVSTLGFTELEWSCLCAQLRSTVIWFLGNIPNPPTLWSSYNESRFPVKMRTKTECFFFSCKCVAAEKIVIQKPL